MSLPQPSILQRLSFNQITADPWSLDEVVPNCAAAAIPSIAVWRHKLDPTAVPAAAALIRAAGLHVSSLCRGGWFSAPTPAERRDRIADNRIAIEQAAILGAPVLIVVSGPANGQSLADARATVLDGLLEILPQAQAAGIVLGIEPLHPMYAAERSVVVTLQQANDLADRLASPFAAVVVDAFHVWWDPELLPQIARAGPRICAFHVSDWPVPLPGILMGRALMGDGVIPLRQLRHAVEAAGYTGPIEVEIFNDALWRAAATAPPGAFLTLIRDRFLTHL